jgi:hypothetical protein
MLLLMLLMLDGWESRESDVSKSTNQSYQAGYKL